MTCVLFNAAWLVLEQSPAAAVVAVSQVDAGFDHTCALDSSGTAYCWGLNDHGQLGDVSLTNRSTPVGVTGSHTFTKISAGKMTTCAIDGSGAGWCWGANGNGAVGVGSGGFDYDSPQSVALAYTWADISTGDDFSCGVRDNGNGYCWGLGVNGRIGNSSNANQVSPALVSGSHSWTSISVGSTHACGLTTAGDAYCWGIGSLGQLGNADLSTYNSPQLVTGSQTWKKVVAGGSTSCGINTSDDLYCWGSDQNGELGDDNPKVSKSSPVAVAGSRKWSTVSVGDGVLCGITTGNANYCWGAGGLGSIGDGGFTERRMPVLVSGSYVFTTINAGGGGPCAITSASSLYCWGYNAYGEIGNGDTTNVGVPVVVLTLSADGDNSTVAAIVDPSLTFTTATHAGACNGVSQSGGASSSATAVSLGHLVNSLSVGAQDLTVATNGYGFTVYLRAPSALGPIDDVPGTNASPLAFPGGGTEAFGYTTSDSTLSTGTPDRFTNGGAQWAALTNTNAEVSAGATPTTSDVVCVAYGAQSTSTTPAGSYSVTVVYTAVPRF